MKATKMTVLNLSVILFLLAATAAAASASTAPTQQQPALFHGTSVVILPSNETSSPVNSTVRAANFFCYMAEEGYFSFGWWVTPSVGSNTSHCVPDSDRFHWYEYASKQSCDPEQGTCRYSTRNVVVRSPHHAAPIPFPERTLEYTIKPVDIGNHQFGQIAVSWIDDGGVQVYGVGTRQVLSDGAEKSIKDDCRKAIRTLRDVYEMHTPELAMKVDWDVCEGVARSFVNQPGVGGRHPSLGDL